MKKSINLKAIAKSSSVISPICEWREKLTTEQVMEKFPDGFRVTCADLYTTTNERGERECSVFGVDDSYYAIGGKIVTKFIKDLLAKCDGDFATMNNVLFDNVLKIKLHVGENAYGMPYTYYTVVEDD